MNEKVEKIKERIGNRILSQNMSPNDNIAFALLMLGDSIREGLSELVKSNKILLLERKLTEEEVEFGKHCCFISNDNDVAGLVDKDCQGDDFYLCDLCAKRDPR